MKEATRLIALLAVAVGMVIAVAGGFILRQREQALETAMRNEVRAHADSLGIALEDHYRAGRRMEAQQLIDSLSKNRRVYGVVLFDADGRVTKVSRLLAPDEIYFPAEARRAISMGETVEIARRIGERDFFYIIRPVQMGESRRAAVEIAQPITHIMADRARAIREIILLACALLAMIALIVLAVTRRNLPSPVGKSLAGRPEEQGEASAREAELRREGELRDSERFATIGRLAAGVAHEIGTPLNVIDAHAARLLNSVGNLEERDRRSLATIRRQVESVSRLVRQLLNLARPHKLHRETVDLALLLDGVREELAAEAARAGVTVEIIAGNQTPVEADRDFLGQALLNICANGLQAMPEGGRLRLECSANPPAGEGQRYAATRISDTGTGIAPEDLPHIFEPFFTTKDVGRGAGLGLAVARRIIEEHGGRIEAANNQEGGATITVYLPQS
jgi:signal transduction histidine kinase